MSYAYHILHVSDTIQYTYMYVIISDHTYFVGLCSLFSHLFVGLERISNWNHNMNGPQHALCCCLA